MAQSLYNRVTWSAIFDPDDYSTPDSGYINISSAGGAITALKALGDYLIVFQEKLYSVFQKRVGDIPFDFLLTKDVGCNSHMTICEIDGWLYYLSDQGEIRKTNGVSDIVLSAGVKELTRTIVNNRGVSDYYNGSSVMMPSALYDRFNNAYHLFYAGTSTTANKSLIYFINEELFLQGTSTQVMGCAPSIDRSSYLGVIGNSDSGGVTYQMDGRYSSITKAGTLDLGWLSSGNPQKKIRLYNVKIWAHADAGPNSTNNCSATLTVTVTTDPSTNTAYATEDQSLTYNSTMDNLQILTFKNIRCLSNYVDIKITDGGGNVNYSIERIVAEYDTPDTTV